MKRIFCTFAVGAALLASARLASADGNRAHAGNGFAAMRLERCLDGLGLSSDVRSSIDGIVAAAKTTLQTDGQTLRADHQKIKTDIDAGADKSVIGQDALTAHADRQKLAADLSSLKSAISGKLTPDQQSQLKGCFRGPRRGASSNSTS